MRGFKLKSFVAVFSFAMLTVWVSAQDSPSDINKGAINFFPIDKEIALGRQLSAQFEKQTTLIDDPTITEYVSRIGQSLVQNSGARIAFTFKVVDSADPNAISLPGGPVYVNAGLVLASEDEGELAFVIAHQIANINARHATELATKAQLVNSSVIQPVFPGGTATGRGSVLPLGWGLAFREQTRQLMPSQFLLVLQKGVLEADYLGLQYLYKTGYDPQAATRFLEKIQKLESATKQGGPTEWRTHPSTDRRIETLQKNIARLTGSPAPKAAPVSEFELIKERLTERGLR